MPRLSTLRTTALSRLADELRFESADAARRQLERVESLVLELLGDAAAGRAAAVYPERWLGQRITGLRGDDRADDPDAGGSVVLEAALGDLGALAQRLSRRARVLGSECPSPAWLSTKEVAARWGVSAKSVERAMRAGLASRRVRVGVDIGRERVVIAREIVEAYERAFGPAKAGAPRVGEHDTARAVRWARGYARRLGWTLDRAAERIGERLGMSRQGVRGLLERAERARAERGEAPIFPGPARAGGSRERAGARRARAERLQRLTRVSSLALDGPTGPTFDRPDASDVLLAPGVVRSEVGPASPMTLAQVLAAGELQQAMSAADERRIAIAACYLLFRARTLRGAIDPLHPGAALIDACETDLRWASRLRARLVAAQLGLVVRTLRTQPGVRSAGLGLGAGGLPPRLALGAVSAGVGALVDAAGQFDPFKGGRLAAPATIAVGRAIVSVMRDGGANAGAAPGRALGRGASVDLGAIAWDGFGTEWQAIRDVDSFAAQRVALLDDPERAVLGARIGMDGSPPVTLEEAARRMGISPQKARAIDAAARKRSGVRC